MHPSRCFPSFVVVVIAATISDHMFCPFTDFASGQWSRECIRWIQHPTSSDQAALDSAILSDVSANVSDVHRFLVIFFETNGLKAKHQGESRTKLSGI